MTERTLRITEQAAGGGRVPRLELAGTWLEEAGFPVGTWTRVDVVEPGRLVVTRVDAAGVKAQGLLPLVWIPAERLAALEVACEEAEREAAHG